MKKFYISFFKMDLLFSWLLFLYMPVSSAQTVTDFSFSAISGSYSPVDAGTELTIIETDEQLSGAIPIGFDFWYLGSRYNIIFACSNGYLSLDNLYTGAVWTNDLIGAGHPTGNGRPVIAPLWDDLDGTKSQTPTSKASYLTSGSAPNRIFTFEWLNWQWGADANQSVISFQVKLYETSGIIEFIYRQDAGAVNNGSASIGITDKLTDAGYFLSVDGTGTSPLASSTVETTSLNSKPATGQIYRFTPTVPAAPTNLTFTNVTITAMKLNWTDNSNNESGFVIYHSTDNTNFEYIKNASANAVNVTVENLETGITHYWKVYSIKGALSSAAAEGSRATLNGTRSGTYVIGSSNPKDYSRISDALTDIFLDGLSGAVILELKSDYNSALEWAFPINIANLGTSADRTITIRPAAGASNLIITTSENTPTIELYGSKYIIIDGRPGGVGSSSELTIENTYSSGSPAIRFYNDASHNQIKYCQLKADNPSTTGGVVHFTNTDIVNYNYGQIYNTIDNCDINGNGKSTNGIYSDGYSSPSYGNYYNTISNNKIRDFYISASSTNSTAGILLKYGNSNWTISNNNIYQTSSRSYSSTSSTHYGIYLSATHSATGFQIENNYIGGSAVNCGGLAWTISSGNYNLNCLYINEPSNTIARNNKIANFSLQEGSLTGILIQNGNGAFYNNQISIGEGGGGSAFIKGIESIQGGIFDFYYNTVYIGGTNSSGSNNSYPFVRSEYGEITLKNNILYNERTGGSGYHYAIANTLTDVSTGYKWLNEGINYNLLVASNSNYVGRWGNSSYTFDGWKTISRSDANSLFEINSSINSAQFFSSLADDNLHINSGNQLSWYSNGKGKPIASVSNDYDSDLRSCTVAGGCTDIGADEFVPAVTPPQAAVNNPPANNSSSSYTFGGSTLGVVNWGANGTVPNSVTLNYNSGTTPPGSLTGNHGNCYWEFTPDGGAGFTYDLTLHYDESQLGTISSEEQIKLAKRDGGDWQHLSESTVDVINNTVTITGLSSFSQFTLSDHSSPLPVELQSFQAKTKGKFVQLNWSTATEINSYCFEVERKSNESKWRVINKVPAHGSSNSIKQYAYTDTVLKANQYTYRLKMIDNDGTHSYSNEVSVNAGIPDRFVVSQNYPNPFNPSTKIDYQLPFDAVVTIEIYSIIGERILIKKYEAEETGYHSKEINLGSFGSGVYIYRITAADFSTSKNNSIIKKMTLIK